MPAKELPEPVNPLWIFIDESGNFDFSPNGTRHFLMTAVVTADPAASGARMLALKYEQMLRGSNQLDFHATHNSRGTRKRVLEVIGGLPGVTSHTFIAEKSNFIDEPQPARSLLARFAVTIAKWSLGRASPAHEHITLVFDTAFPGDQAEFLKHHMKSVFVGSSITYRIHFHRVANEPNGQLADYVAWAHSRFITRADPEGLQHLDPEKHTMQALNK